LQYQKVNKKEDNMSRSPDQIRKKAALKEQRKNGNGKKKVFKKSRRPAPGQPCYSC